ncbi:MAG: hypothetical protein ACXVW6_10590 [Nocardioidaceae bacterium]
MRAVRRILAIVGAVALVVGLLAGVADRQLLDTSRFVTHADRVRQDPAVARHLAEALSDALIEEQPDLVAVRPLLEGTLQGVVRSPAFRPLFRTAVAPLHQALTGQAPPTLVLRLADLGAVLLAVVRPVLPDEAAERLPTDLEVRLARLGSGDPSRMTVSGLRTVRVLSWLGPLVSLLCFAGVVALARGRRGSALGGVGMTIAASGVALALLGVVVSFLAARIVPDTLTGSLVAAGWRQLAAPLRDTALIAAGAGYLLAVASRRPVLAGLVSGLGAGAGAWRGWLATVRWADLPVRARLSVASAATIVGVLLVLEPSAMVTVLAIIAGAVIGLHGAVALARIAGGAITTWAHAHGAVMPGRGAQAGGPPRFGVVAAATVALALLVGLVVWNSGGSTAAGSLRKADPTACNGSPQLCGRRYDQVSFPATHNSMAAADQPGWFLAEQPNGLLDQLDAGIRGFLIDTWYGQATERSGVVANTEDHQAAALAEAEREWGADVVASVLRLRQAARLVPEGPTSAYLCHALCVLGSTAWEPLMAQIRTWLDGHPREVITFILQDEVSPATTARVFADAGLLPEVYTPSGDGAWPTLEQMIDSGHRIVVMAENQGGGERYPWLLPAFEEVQDTPFNARRVGDFSCRLNRGPATAPLFLVNHWLNRPLRVSASREANSDAVLGARLDTCRQERGMLPNFVAVDNYDQGDLLGQVRRLNGL